MDDRSPQPPRRPYRPRQDGNRERIDGRPTPRRSAQAPETSAADLRREQTRTGGRHAAPNSRHTATGRPSAASRPSASGRPAPSPRTARPRARQAPEGRGGQVPSWYDPATSAHTTRAPRPTLDASLDETRWHSDRSRDVYAGRAPKRRSRLPFILGGGIAAIILVAILVNVGIALTAPPADEGTDQSLAVADAASQTTSLTISFAGDCTLGTDAAFDQSRSFNAKYDEVGDPAYFFSNVADIFAQDDLSVVNMEGTLTEQTARADKTYAFKGPADYAQILVKGNIETADLANNHSHDYGDASYTDTIAALDAAGIGSFGYDRIDYRDVKGVKVALIGTYELADGIACQDEMKQNIQKAKDQGAQITIVFFHWGNEKDTVPDDTQIQLGHIAVDAGADLVVGSHPHVIQGYEKYNGRYIVYSLGNFCFGGNANPSDKDCMIFQQTFSVTGSDVATDDAINVIPCSISSSSSTNNYQPTPAEGDEKARIEAKIKESADAIATRSSSLQGQSASGQA